MLPYVGDSHLIQILERRGLHDCSPGTYILSEGDCQPCGDDWARVDQLELVNESRTGVPALRVT